MRVLGFKRVGNGDGIAIATEDMQVLVGSPSPGGVWQVEATDDEIAEARSTLVLDDSAALAEALYERITSWPVRGGEGRPRSARYYADSMAADLRGIKRESVRVDRARKAGAASSDIDGVQVGTIDALGQTLEADWLEPIGKAQALLARAASRLSSARAALTQALALNGDGDDIVVPTAKLERLRSALDDASAEARSLVPRSLCPACKAIDGYVQECATCLSAGWVGDKVTRDSLPDELFDTERTFVLSDGKVLEVTTEGWDEAMGELG